MGGGEPHLWLFNRKELISEHLHQLKWLSLFAIWVLSHIQFPSSHDSHLRFDLWPCNGPALQWLWPCSHEVVFEPSLPLLQERSRALSMRKVGYSESGHNSACPLGVASQPSPGWDKCRREVGDRGGCSQRDGVWGLSVSPKGGCTSGVFSTPCETCSPWRGARSRANHEETQLSHLIDLKWK